MRASVFAPVRYLQLATGNGFVVTSDPVNSFDEDLRDRLAALRQQGLYRELRRVDSPQSTRICVQGKTLLNFSSNDYLGLANEPSVKEAAAAAIERSGAGAGASRLVCGSLAPHHEVEEALAAFKGSEAAISFSSGYATAIGTVCALLEKTDVVIIDRLAHACIVDAARLSGAKLRVFRHNDLNDLERILKWAVRTRHEGGARDGSPTPRILIVTESLFSMDGDFAPLAEIVSLKERYGAWLMVDEAHGTGILGANRRGLAEECGISDRIEIQMGTLGKAIGSAGGYICGSRALVDFLINRSRTFIFSTAPVPAAAAAATAGVRFIQSGAGEERRRLLLQRIGELNSNLELRRAKFVSPILPIHIGDEAEAVRISTALRDRGIFVPAIRYPTVARGSARLRITMTAAHTPADVAALATAVREFAPASPVSKA